ncbi:adp-ribose pyrophosphatase [hydrocarbon metagenome]|uniref:Adp-ribose pyrophosphatase n=1 Tax=hydrocarbon metagenome TaxID=938273 RepID=A0A0W8E821_9ZZZZ
MDFEEKTISSTTIFDGRIVRLRVDDVSLPDGGKSKREIVEHPGAVAVLAMDEENNVWMVSQYRKAVEQVLMEIPAGTLEENEDPLECARRELAEETGLIAAEWQEIISYYCAPGFCNEKTVIYTARQLSQGSDLSLDRDEFIEVSKIPLEKAYQHVLDGRIVDGKSIIAVQYAIQNYLEK